jgi:hypothetical protein
VAQTADFRCAAPNTVVEFSDGSRATWLSADGNRCKGQFKDKDGNEFSFVWYLPTVGLRADQSLAFAEQMKPWTLWPLAVGKKLAGRFDGPSSSAGGSGSWYDTITVQKYEKVTTRAGTYDAFVVTRQEDAVSHSFKSTQREWYVPSLGVAVKSEYTTNQGVNRTREAVSVRQ